MMKVIEKGFNFKWRFILPVYDSVQGAGHRKGKYVTYHISFLCAYIVIERSLCDA